MVSRLKEKGYSKSATEKALAYLKRHNYINDENFTHSYVRWCCQKGWGPRKIDFQLQKSGIKAGLRQKALALGNYQDRIREIIEKKAKAGPIQELKLKAKIIRYLRARGFDHRDIDEQIMNYENK